MTCSLSLAIPALCALATLPAVAQDDLEEITLPVVESWSCLPLYRQVA